MIYTYDENIHLSIPPQSFNKNSSKEILQYAIGGLLYMPATRTKIADDIILHKHPEFRSICLDLEDAVGDDTVTQAEICLHDTLLKIYNANKSGVLKEDDIPLIFIRVRNPQQLGKIKDICNHDSLSIITGFNLPKFDKSNCGAYIHEFTKIQEQTKQMLYIMPIIESKDVMYQQRRTEQLTYMQDRLSEISDHILNIRVGATDFCSLFGIRRDISASIYDMKVVADCFADIINMFARNYVCSGPVWEFFDSNNKPGKWSEGLIKELRMDKLNGFFGKTCIHPSQLKYINESNIVSYENYQDAISILGMSDGLIGVQKGFGNNKMNEVKTHTHWAKRIIGRAIVYGVAAKET